MKNFKKVITVIGGGPFATALAYILTQNNNKVIWYMRNEEIVKSLIRKGVNHKYLPWVRFNKAAISPTNNLQEAVDCSEFIVIAVPSAYLYDAVLSAVPGIVWKEKKIISAVKGLVTNGNKLLNDYLRGMYDFPIENYVSLMGPCHAEEIAKGLKSYPTFSGLDEKLTKSVSTLFAGKSIEARCNNDVWGAQFAAILKNVYAIGAGIATKLDGYGDNFTSVYVTNCRKEMVTFLGKHFNLVHPAPDMPDFSNSVYLGDLLVTAYSSFSRNRTFGGHVGKGLSPKAASDEMADGFPEGYYAAKAMMEISKEHKLKIPIAKAVYEILWNGASSEQIFEKLCKTFN
ncbi:MAG: NAD(P)-binding domain-containing protein [Candidatus Pacebacteria bacterium]|nr:NAD(P)-binding domain-containing protein [Candidatus Paceibacterota bacterium]